MKEGSWSNMEHAQDAAIAFCLHSQRHLRRASEAGRSSTPYSLWDFRWSG